MSEEKPPSWDAEVRRLFDAAAALPPDGRGELLEAASVHDPEIAAEVRELLRHHDTAEAVLDCTPADLGAVLSRFSDGAVAEHATTEGVLPSGTRFGSYTLIRELGRGGMGVVYEAEQASPRRRVAVKLIRSELATPAMIRRFEHEAAALGMLQHPGIAQVFEAGSAVLDGQARPYIAMELCEGEPITSWVRTSAAPHRARLALMARVCDAVQHAHQRGVIHRDLKPANLLVSGSTDDPRVRVLDFGIARLAEESGALPAPTLATSVGQIIGTVGYMSPEQAAGDPSRVDARTDVYSLGVVLYEMLCGRRPIESESGSVPEMFRLLETADPAPPSRSAAAGARLLRGDVDTICLRALARDPAARYQHVSELGADLRRFLAGEPISVRPYTRWQLAGRFARRHRPWVVGGAAVMLALVIGLGVAAWQAVRATRASREADRRADVALKGGAFLRRMLDAAIPEAARGSDITVAEMFGAASRDLDADTSLDPEVAGTLHKTLADGMLAIGDGDSAERHARRSFELRTAILGADHPQTLESASSLAEALTGVGRRDEGLSLVRESLGRAERALGPDHEVTIDLTALLAWSIEDVDIEGAMRTAREAIARADREFGPADRRTLLLRSNLGIQLMSTGRDEEGLEVLRQAMVAREESLGRLHPDTLSGLYNFAGALIRTHRATEAEPIIDELVRRSRELLGEMHPATLYAEYVQGIAMNMTGRHEEAAEVFASNLTRRERRLGADAYHTIRSRVALAGTLLSLRRLDEAAALLEGCYESDLRRNGPEHPATRDTARKWVILEGLRGDAAAVEQWEERAGSAPPGR